MPVRETIEVVAGILQDARGRVLICQRPAGKPLAGYWEFPGGKIESGESPDAALRRELAEELDLEAGATQALLRLTHDYPDRRVVLSVRRIAGWTGAPRPLEAQPLAWVRPEELHGYALLPADWPIVAALTLPDRCLITPEPGNETGAFLGRLEAALERGVRLVQFRAPGLSSQAYAALAPEVIRLCRRAGAKVLLNAAPELARDLGADGVHLNARRLREATQRPLPRPMLVGASCHEPGELRRAAALGADFALLGPVRATASHPERAPLGWASFAAWTAEAGLPVYALGGMQVGDIERAHRAGGQGIAAIRGFWQASETETNEGNL